ncbi:hypothetical protein [Parvibaculum sp.]|uniref:hypothetical protein n=1 Tax=Parvibaculum sp. TaxID=2024848 RepID=UPI002BFB0787|nr:hypothetical protein [Parvibaculum sp.]HUD52325.1 hypothetical protein [Parvibaculum sp.]
MTIDAIGASRDGQRKMAWTPFAVVLAGDALIFAAVFAVYRGDTTDALLHAARYTARFSFLVFLLPFLASSLAWWWPATRGLRANRRVLGLSFALAHFIHLGALTGFFLVSGQSPSPLSLAGGGGAYVMIALMAATSNDRSVKTLGPRLWGRLHLIGAWYIWFIFTFSYFGRVTKDAPQEPRWIYVTLFALAVAAFVLRVATWTARRRAA